MKSWILTLISIISAFSLVGCTSGGEDPLAGNYYLGSEYTTDTYIRSTIVLFFGDDQQVQVVDAGLSKDEDERESYYGAYFCEDNVLTIKIADSEYTGIVTDEGETIKITSAEFSRTEFEELTEKTKAAFE